MSDGHDLGRFTKAQGESVYRTAVAELRDGRKTSHWMWFVFPQLAGLGRSETARFYGISGLAEARAYLAHDELGKRLAECTSAVLGWSGERSAREIFGEVDAIKFRSSMTLFEQASDDPDIFAQSLENFCGGERDEKTLALL